MFGGENAIMRTRYDYLGNYRGANPELVARVRRNSSGFSEGLAAITEGLNPSRTKEETFVYIDKTGKIVLATEFLHASEFRDGLAAVYSSRTNQWGFIDKTGKVVIPLQYELVNDFSEGLALVGLYPQP